MEKPKKKRKSDKIDWKRIKTHLMKPIICQFYDHAMGGDPVMCNVVGYLSKMTDKYIQIVSWDVPELEGSERRANMEYFSILKSTIIKVLPLRASKKFG